jgi:hypothetical protein
VEGFNSGVKGLRLTEQAGAAVTLKIFFSVLNSYTYALKVAVNSFQVRQRRCVSMVHKYTNID